MPKAKPPANKRKDAAPTPAPAPAKRTRPHRSPQTPFEANGETVYAVDKIINVRWTKGSREYLVRWEGFAASHDTWEPMENLVGCAAQIREYENRREKEDKDAAELVLAKRQKAKEDAAAEAAAVGPVVAAAVAAAVQ